VSLSVSRERGTHPLPNHRSSHASGVGAGREDLLDADRERRGSRDETVEDPIEEAERETFVHLQGLLVGATPREVIPDREKKTDVPGEKHFLVSSF